MSYRKTIANCLYCGTAFEKYRTDHIYCGPDCRRRARNEKERVDIPSEWICIHNEGVKCSPRSRNCASCGWDPEVAEERLRRNGKELGPDVHDI